MNALTRIRLGLGAALVVAPRAVGAVLTGSAVEPRATTATRLFGLRQVTQALVTSQSEVSTRRAAALAELVLAGALLTAARRDEEHRQLLLVAGLVELAFASLGIATAERPRRDAAGPSASTAEGRDTTAYVVEVPVRAFDDTASSATVTRRNRERRATLQLAIVRAHRRAHHQAPDRVREVVLEELAAVEALACPQTWVESVVSSISSGHLYVVGTQSLADAAHP